jgi:hypothetical protein
LDDEDQPGMLYVEVKGVSSKTYDGERTAKETLALAMDHMRKKMEELAKMMDKDGKPKEVRSNFECAKTE